MEIRKIVLGKVIELLRLIGKDNFNIIKVYNDYKKNTLTVLYTNDKLEEVEKELCNYGDKPFTKEEINELNKYVRLLNNAEEKYIKVNVDYLNKEILLTAKEIDKNKQQIQNLKKVILLTNLTILTMIIINIIKLLR